MVHSASHILALSIPVTDFWVTILLKVNRTVYDHCVAANAHVAEQRRRD